MPAMQYRGDSRSSMPVTRTRAEVAALLLKSRPCEPTPVTEPPLTETAPGRPGRKASKRKPPPPPDTLQFTKDTSTGLPPQARPHSSRYIEKPQPELLWERTLRRLMFRSS